MKKVLCFVFVVVFSLVLTSCGTLYKSTEVFLNNSANKAENQTNYENNTENIVLTERQKEVLMIENLPTDVEELSEYQINSITAIEELFCYLDGKYDEEFEYCGYIAPSYDEPQQLLVKVKGMTDLDEFSVTREHDGTTFDDYPRVAARYEYEYCLKQFALKYTSKAQVFANIAEVEEAYLSDKNIKHINSSNIIVFSEKSISKSEIEKFVVDYAEWYASQVDGLPNRTEIFLYSDDDYYDITAVNNQTKKREISSLFYKDIMFSSDGEVTTKE